MLQRFTPGLLVSFLLVSLFITACGRSAEPASTHNPVTEPISEQATDSDDDLSDRVFPLRPIVKWAGEITFKYSYSDRTPVLADPGFPIDLSDKENFEEVHLVEVVALGESSQDRNTQEIQMIPAEVEINGSAKLVSYSTVGDSPDCYGFGEAHAEADLKLHENVDVLISYP